MDFEVAPRLHKLPLGQFLVHHSIAVQKDRAKTGNERNVGGVCHTVYDNNDATPALHEAAAGAAQTRIERSITR
jgi:hypothetical protein